MRMVTGKETGLDSTLRPWPTAVTWHPGAPSLSPADTLVPLCHPEGTPRLPKESLGGTPLNAWCWGGQEQEATYSPFPPLPFQTSRPTGQGSLWTERDHAGHLGCSAQESNARGQEVLGQVGGWATCQTVPPETICACTCVDACIL